MVSSMVTKVLFVCLGNICRSPAAENVMNYMVRESGEEARIQCDSAGTGDWHIGNSPDPRMQKALEGRGVPVTGAARQVKREDLEAFDYVLVMDKSNLVNVRRLDPSGEFHDKIQLFGEFCQQTPGAEVPDPYYGEEDGFELVMDMLEDGCSNLLSEIVESLDLEEV